jgi:hypothetical protein
MEFLHSVNIFDRNENNENNKNIINILVSSGLTVTLDTVKELARHELDFEKFYDYGLKVDDELFKICAEHKFSPSYLNDFNFTQEELHKLFLHCNKLSEIKSFIKSKNVTFDLTCLKNACKVGHNRGIINFLIKKGVTPDFECLKLVIKTISNPIINYVFDELVKNNDIMVTPKNEKITK